MNDPHVSTEQQPVAREVAVSDAEELRLAPQQGRSAEQVLRELEPLVVPVYEPPAQRRPQFSLRHLMIAVAGMSAACAGVRACATAGALSGFAGMVGIAGIVYMIAMIRWQPNQPAAHLAWWLLLSTYALAVVCALWIG